MTHPVRSMTSSRARRGVLASCWRWLAAACLALGAVAPAWATCPATVSLNVPAGGSVALTCAIGGGGTDWGFTEVILGTPVPTTHGSLSVTDNNFAVTYFNTGGAGQTDVFTLTNGEHGSTQTTFTITIGASASPLTLTPSLLPNPSVAVPYSQQLSTSGGTAPYVYSITAGGLPPGLSMTSGGLISGTSTGADNYFLTIHVEDSAPTHLTLDKSMTLVIAAPNLDLSPDNPPTAAIGQAYSTQFSVTGGTGPYTYSIELGQGNLPPGMSLSSGGLLSGTPTSTGSYTFSLKYLDTGTTFSSGGQAFKTQNVTVVVSNATAPGAPTIGTATAGDAQASVTFAAPASNGGAAITGYTVTSSPGGITATGSGSPLTVTGLTNGTAYTFTVTATNSIGTGSPSSASNSVTPKGAQTITFSNPGTQNFGTTPTLTATASSSLTPTFTSSTTGVCTITSGGALSFLTTGTCTISADQAGNSAFLAAAAVGRSFTVNAVVPAAPTIGTATAGNGQASVSFTAPANTGGTAISSYTATSSPGGITASGSGSPLTVTGLTNGTAYTFTVTAANTAGTGAASAASNSVTPLSPVVIAITPTTSPSGTVGSAYSQAFTASGGTAPYSYAVTAGSLPAGLSLSASGLLSGTPTAGGSYNFTITASDANTVTGSRTLTLSVSGPTISVSPSTLPAASAGVAYSQTTTASGGTAPYAFTVTAGALPAGLSLGSSGTLSGTPTTSGTFNFTITATDSSTGTGPYSGSRAYSLTANAATISLPTTSLSNGTRNSSYSASLNAASGGTAPYTYAVTAGALPAGITLAANGALSGTPTAAGTANFTVTATDSTAGSGPFSANQTYTLTVADTVPVVGAVSASVAFNSSSNPITLNISGGTPTSVAIASAAAHGTATASGTSISYTPTAGYTGSDTFTYTATNASGTSSPATVTITVNAPAAPTVSAKSVSTAYNTPAAIDLSGSITGAGITAVTIGTSPAHGTVSVSGETVTYTPSSTFYGGSDSFTYTATNPGGTSAPATVSITVGLPAAPTAAAKAVSTPYNTVASIDLTGSITGVNITAVTIGTGPTHGTVAVSGETVTYTPSSTYYGGSDSFTYTATNAGGTSAPATVSLTIGVPGAPTASAKSVATPFNTAASIDLTGSITGVNITAVTIGTGPTHGTVAVSGETVTYTPSSTYYGGSDSFTYTATNPGGTSAPATVSITVGAPAIPTVAAKAVSTPYNTAASIDLSGSISGINITALTIGTAPTHGTVSVSGETVTYTPSSGFFGGSDSFTYTATNPGGTSAPATVTITVGAPAIPTATAKTVSTPYNTAASIDLSGSITGVNITALTIGTAPTHGTVSVSGETVTYTPSSTYYGGTDSFTYTATNPGGTSAPATVTITVGAPAIPTAAAKTVSTPYNTAASIDLSGSITGINVSALTIGAAPTQGTVAVSGETVIYTPSASFFGGSDSFTYTATNPGGTSAPATVTITVGAPAIPTGADRAVSTPFNTAALIDLTSSITGINVSALTIGAAPTHGTVAVSGETVTYTPSSSFFGGSDSFTYTATNPGGTSAPATVTISVGAPAIPTVAAKAVSTAYNTAASIDLSGSITGVNITALTIGTAPTHGTVAVSGETVTYTPSSSYYGGSDSFTYTATNPGGTSAPATVTITVTPLAEPTAMAQTVTTLAGKAVTIHATTGATGGPFTAVTLTSTPASGTAVVSGEDIVYTPTADASGPVSFSYTLSNNFGVSPPATITVEVHPVPQVVAQSVNALAGTTVQVDLAWQALGGPFTGADLISVSPASAGTGSIVKNGNGYRLDFATAASFNGAAEIRFTLTNAYATSATGIVTVNITARADPAKDADVLGILGAQAQATRRFAVGQIDNFQRRLEGLHGSADMSTFSNGLSFSSGSGVRRRGELAGAELTRVGDLQRRYLVQPDNAQAATDTGSSSASRPGALAFWAGGAVNFGTQKLGGSYNGVDFTTSGISVGADTRVSSDLALGVGAGYGHDASDIGHEGSRSTSNSYNVTTYASFHPSESTYVDGLIGYQWLSFDSRRYLSANGGQVSGSREGTQWFGSLAAGYDHRTEHMQLSPYGRLDMASGRLDGYAEQGDALYSLRYDAQTVKTTTGSVGLRMNYPVKRDFGLLTPQLRVEYQHDFQGSSSATMRYADVLTGPLYRAEIGGQSRNHTLLGVGLQLQTWRGLMFRVEYQNLFDNSSSNNQSILLGLEVPFNP